MQSNYEKVIIMRDETGIVKGMVLHDSLKHAKCFYNVKEMEMEDLMEIVNQGQVPNGSYFELPIKIKKHE